MTDSISAIIRLLPKQANSQNDRMYDLLFKNGTVLKANLAPGWELFYDSRALAFSGFFVVLEGAFAVVEVLLSVHQGGLSDNYLVAFF